MAQKDRMLSRQLKAYLGKKVSTKVMMDRMTEVNRVQGIDVLFDVNRTGFAINQRGLEAYMDMYPTGDFAKSMITKWFNGEALC